MRGFDMIRALILAGLMASPALAAPPPLVVEFDGGGRVDWRGAEIRRLAAEGRSVEIVGECVSACTMYLAIGCVGPDARLTFHGPSYFGMPISRHDFDVWSQYIADHYPPALSEWFMATARHRNHLPLPPLGQAQLVAMGARACG